MTSVEESLARLKLDRVDILHIHDPDDHYDAALAGAYRALAKLRQEGVVGAIGAGMNQWQMLQRFAEDADFDCFLLAGRYTLLDRSAAGQLSSAVRAEVDLDHRRRRLQQRHPRRPARRREIQLRRRSRRRWSRRRCGSTRICKAHGVPLKAAAIQFPFTHPAVARADRRALRTRNCARTSRCSQTPIAPDLWNALRDTD